MLPPRERYSSPSESVAAAAAAAGMAAIAVGRDDEAGPADSRRDDGWEFPAYDPHVLDKNKKHYRSYMMEFMTFFHRWQGKEVTTTYPLTTMFTREQLLEITPKAVHDWMATKTYGKAVYGPGEMRRSPPLHS